MAKIQESGPVFTIAGVNDYYLTNASDEGVAGGVMLHIVGNAATGSITVKAESSLLNAAAQNSGATDAPQPIVYRGFAVNGAAGTGAYVSTAITASSIIFIPSCGMTPVLNVTALSAGTFTVYVVPVIGSAAL